MCTPQLRGLAGAFFSTERHGHTLQPTALINEAWIRMSPQLDRIDDRVHFFAVASRAMRQVLVDHARHCRRQKRGGEVTRVPLEEHLGCRWDSATDFVDLDDSLTRLAALNARHARVVELRILGGLTIAEAAVVLGVSHTTIEGDWFTAKAWLRKELGGTP